MPALARLRRSVLESSKQCGRNRLMQILDPVDLGQLVQSVADAASIGEVSDCQSVADAASIGEVSDCQSVADAASIGSKVDVTHADASSVGHESSHSRDRVLKLFAHPYGEVKPLNQLQLQAKSAAAVTVVIGPEGGFTDEEANFLRANGWIATSLGPRILRVEVAATHVASWLAELAF